MVLNKTVEELKSEKLVAFRGFLFDSDDNRHGTIEVTCHLDNDGWTGRMAYHEPTDVTADPVILDEATQLESPYRFIQLYRHNEQYVLEAYKDFVLRKQDGSR